MSEVVKIECPHCSQRIALPEGFNQPSATCPVCKGGIELEFDEALPASDGTVAPPAEGAETKAEPKHQDLETGVGGAEAWEEETDEQEAASKPNMTVAPPTGEVTDGQWAGDEGDRGPRVEKGNLFVELFSFKGRIRRTTYWIISIIQTVFMGVLLGLMMICSAASVIMADAEGMPNAGIAILGVIIFGLGMIPLMWISFATVAKRFHDREKSGWWSLLILTVVGGLWILVECGFLEGTRGPNRFGFDPKAT